MASPHRDHDHYAIAGFDGTTRLSSVERAAINADGSLGPWQLTAGLNTAREGPAAAASGGYLYAIGGSANGTSGFTSVARAAVSSDGTLGAWQAVNSLAAARFYEGTVVSGGWLYALGGFNNALLSSVERTPLSPPTVTSLAPRWRCSSSPARGCSTDRQ